jgi:hypothetical protein
MSAKETIQYNTFIKIYFIDFISKIALVASAGKTTKRPKKAP